MIIKNKNKNGFTLIETLVAIIVISIGILGFALMQIESLKAAKSATEQSKAIHLATDMMDRIRTNKRFATSYAAALGAAGSAPSPLCADSATTAAITTPLTTCSGAEMAAFEVWQWRSMIEDPNLGFASGQGAIVISGTNPWAAEITVQWSIKGTSQQYVLSSIIH